MHKNNSNLPSLSWQRFDKKQVHLRLCFFDSLLIPTLESKMFRFVMTSRRNQNGKVHFFSLSTKLNEHAL